MAQSIFDLQAALCHAMANASRLRIVHLLRDGPQRVGEIAKATHLPNSQVSQQLAVLRAHSIVTAQRNGSEIVYRLANPKIARVCDSMREVLVEQAAASAAIVQMLHDSALSKTAKK